MTKLTNRPQLLKSVMNSKMIELRITNYVFIVHVLLKLLSVVILLVLSSNVFHNRLTLA